MEDHDQQAGVVVPAGTATPAGRPIVEFRGVTQTFPRPGTDEVTVAVEDLTFSVRQGEFLSIVGPSGCGKSTLLSMIAGLLPPTRGEVRLDGERVTGVRRDVGFIFQKDALLPWRSALDNVALGPRFRDMKRRAARELAREWLARVGLAGFEGHYPHQLSGGMRKRVAIAATLVYEPRILLMDEPFSALDVQTRNFMEEDLLHIWGEAEDQTVVFVTHDLEEAIALSDRIIILSASPARLDGDHVVPFARPRRLLEVKFEEGYSELYHEIWSRLGVQVMKAQRIGADRSRPG